MLYKMDISYQEFVNAVKNNNVQKVKSILNDPEIDIYSTINYEDNGYYPIIYAIKNKNIEIIDILLNNELLNVNIQYKNRILFEYIMKKDINLIYKLLSHPLFVIDDDVEYYSPLFIAAKANNLNLLKEVLKYQNIIYTNVLVSIINLNNIDIIKIVLNKNNKSTIDLSFDNSYKDLIESIVLSKNIEIVKFFLEERSDIGFTPNTILQESMKKKINNIIIYLFDNSLIDIKSVNYGLLKYSLYLDDEELFIKLINLENLNFDLLYIIENLNDYITLNKFKILINKYKSFINKDINFHIVNIIFGLCVRNARVDILNFLIEDKNNYDKINIHYIQSLFSQNILYMLENNILIWRYILDKFIVIDSISDLNIIKNKSKVIDLTNVFSNYNMIINVNYSGDHSSVFNLLLSYEGITVSINLLYYNNFDLRHEYSSLISLIKLD